MSTPWTGRCLCGAVQYKAHGDSLAQLICHCSDCQRASGSAGLPVVVVRAASFSFEGEIRRLIRRSAAAQCRRRATSALIAAGSGDQEYMRRTVA
ncbi:GFA family protein [Paraburkholderia sp. JPY419]|uniref:GFA family protein n=1 Tax=Paraburkholderia sp. JPY419 TaxID=667660 RepID=UPI003D1D6D6F